MPLTIISKQDNGKKEETFATDGKNFYRITYKYISSYGFTFIHKFSSLSNMENELSVTDGEIIYSSTNQNDCTDEGRKIEYEISTGRALE